MMHQSPLHVEPQKGHMRQIGHHAFFCAKYVNSLAVLSSATAARFAMQLAH